jgi:hypothetical protein
MKFSQVMLVLCLASAIQGQSMELLSYENFSDGLEGWTETRFSAVYQPPIYNDTIASCYYDENRECVLARPLPEVSGWTLCRYGYWGDDPWPTNPGCMWVEFGEDDNDTVRNVATAGNFYEGSADRLPLACTMHRFASPGGRIAFRMHPKLPAGNIIVDNLAIYAVPDSLLIDPSTYANNVTIERMGAPRDSLFNVTYSGIPVVRQTLIIHVEPSAPERRAQMVFVDGAPVAFIHEDFLQHDEVTFAWQPEGDTASIRFRYVQDTVPYTEQELILFSIDIDTALVPAGALAMDATLRHPRHTGRRAEHLSNSSIVDLLGRTVQTAAGPHGLPSGVFIVTQHDGSPLPRMRVME